MSSCRAWDDSRAARILVLRRRMFHGEKAAAAAALDHERMVHAKTRGRNRPSWVKVALIVLVNRILLVPFRVILAMTGNTAFSFFPLSLTRRLQDTPRLRLGARKLRFHVIFEYKLASIYRSNKRLTRNAKSRRIGISYFTSRFSSPSMPT